MKSINISIIKDSLAEPAEQFVIVITNVTGGASLPSTSNPLKVPKNCIYFCYLLHT